MPRIIQNEKPTEQLPYAYSQSEVNVFRPGREGRPFHTYSKERRSEIIQRLATILQQVA